MKKTFLFPIVLVAALLAGCGGGGSASLSKDDVAVVGKVHVTKKEYDALLAQAQRSFKQQGRPFPKQGTTDYETVKGQAVTLLVQQAEREAKASDMGIKISDADIDKRLAQIKKQYFPCQDPKAKDQTKCTETRYLAQLKKQNLTDAQVRNDIRSQLISEAVFNKVTGAAKVSDSDVHDYYITHPQLYTQPQSRDVRYILVKKKADADSVYAQVKAGGD
jgi:parvulin-like peptidyl-prolyl isomerase